MTTFLLMKFKWNGHALVLGLGLKTLSTCSRVSFPLVNLEGACGPAPPSTRTTSSVRRSRNKVLATSAWSRAAVGSEPAPLELCTERSVCIL